MQIQKLQAGLTLIAEALTGAAAPVPAPAPSAADPGRKISTAELAARYGVCLRTVQNWRDRGCPCEKISPRAYRYDLVAVEAWHAAVHAPEEKNQQPSELLKRAAVDKGEPVSKEKPKSVKSLSQLPKGRVRPSPKPTGPTAELCEDLGVGDDVSENPFAD